MRKLGEMKTGPPPRIVPESVIRQAPAPLREAVQAKLAAQHPFALPFPELRRALECYLVLSDFAEVFLDSFSPEEVFWSRYFWFIRYGLSAERRFGPDAGIEQQAFQILEAPYPRCDPDWEQLEKVEQRAREESSEPD